MKNWIKSLLIAVVFMFGIVGATAALVFGLKHEPILTLILLFIILLTVLTVVIRAEFWD